MGAPGFQCFVSGEPSLVDGDQPVRPVVPDGLTDGIDPATDQWGHVAVVDDMGELEVVAGIVADAEVVSAKVHLLQDSAYFGVGLGRTATFRLPGLALDVARHEPQGSTRRGEDDLVSSRLDPRHETGGTLGDEIGNVLRAGIRRNRLHHAPESLIKLAGEGKVELQLLGRSAREDSRVLPGSRPLSRS